MKKHLFRLEQQKTATNLKERVDLKVDDRKKNTVYNFGNETVSRVCLALTLLHLVRMSAREWCENEKRNIIVKMLNKGY